jgi:4-hydroxy-tetrahydrodipicolinate synthase
MNLSSKFTGTGVAIVTPFKADSSLDLPALEKIVDHIIKGGCNYIVALGTTGESVTLSKDEKKEVMKCIRKANNQRVPLMLGIGGNNTKEILDQIAHTDFEGFDAVLSVSPYYNKPNQEGICRHYEAIADASPLPVLLYNVPGRTGMNMTAETTLRLAKHPKIFGVKEASGNFDQCMEILRNKPSDFMVISGDDAYTLPFIAMGMQGVISVVANAYPGMYSQMTRECIDFNFTEAQHLHYKLLNTIKLMFSDGSPGGVKAYLHQMGLCENIVRMPLAPVSQAVMDNIKQDFERLKAGARA